MQSFDSIRLFYKDWNLFITLSYLQDFVLFYLLKFQLSINHLLHADYASLLLNFQFSLGLPLSVLWFIYWDIFQFSFQIYLFIPFISWMIMLSVWVYLLFECIFPDLFNHTRDSLELFELVRRTAVLMKIIHIINPNQHELVCNLLMIVRFERFQKIAHYLLNLSLHLNYNKDQLMQKQKCVCVLGSANSDMFLKVPHIPLEGETIQCSEAVIKNGGKGANQAVAISRLNCPTVFCGQVGKDSMMQKLRQQMLQAKVQLAWNQLSNVSTGQAIIFIDQKGQNSIVIIGGANMKYQEFKLSKQVQNSILKSDLLMLQKQVPAEINILAAKFAKQNHKIVVMDCGGRDDPITQELLQNLDYISPNQTQLTRLIEVEKPITLQKVRPFLQKYPNIKLLLKQSIRGCTLFSLKEQTHQPIVSDVNEKILNDYKVVDTVGAGDCFTGAFGVGLLRGMSPRESMLFANSAAFLCVSRSGAMCSMPKLQQVNEFMNKYELNKLN